MTDVAAFANVDVAAREFQRRIGPHAFDLLDGVFEIEQRRDFNDAADRNDEERANEQQCCVAFQQGVFVENGHGLCPPIPLA
ncbi:hypothetical protein D3C71_2040310 [compost metagenome]